MLVMLSMIAAPSAAYAFPEAIGSRRISSSCPLPQATVAARPPPRRAAVIASEEPPAARVNVGSLVGYALLLVYLGPFFIRAAAPQIAERINMFTDIANNAADEALAAGSLLVGTVFGYPIQNGTLYAQGVFKDLIAEYFASGSTAFLTRAGGVCAQHAAWCDGVTIVP